MVFKAVLFLKLTVIISISACNTRKDENGFVCVCNSSYCDKVPELRSPRFGQYQIYSTGKSKPGFNTQIGDFSGNRNKSGNILSVNLRKTYQKIIGFGGAFTDATGINIDSLGKEVQANLIESYFGKAGIEYSLCRVPIGGTDFSPRPYSYDDYSNDTKLKHFKLQDEDFKYKVNSP